MPAATPIASETIAYGAAIGSTVPELMKVTIKPEMPPTQGPARIPPSTVPIESRKSGSLRVLAIAWPTQSIAMQTGMRTMARVFILTLNALRTPTTGPPSDESGKVVSGQFIVPPKASRQQALLRMTISQGGPRRSAGEHQHGPGRARPHPAATRRDVLGD